MSGLSTKDIKIGGVPKTINPGEHILKLNGISLLQYDFMKEKDGYYLVLSTETAPIGGDFEGFLLDKDKEDGPRYEGQVGQIKTDRWFYKDDSFDRGGKTIHVYRDTVILKQLKILCKALGEEADQWFLEQDGKHATIEDFVAAFNDTALMKDKWLRFCVGGREFEKDEGHVGYDLHLPKYKKGFVTYEPEDADPSKLLPFDEEEHVDKVEPDTEDDDEGDDTGGIDGIPDGDDTTEEAPEFEL